MLGWRGGAVSNGPVLWLQPPAQPSGRMTSPRPFVIFRPPRIPHSQAPLLTGHCPALVGAHLRQGFWPTLPAAQDWSPVCGQDTGHPPSIRGLAVPGPRQDGWAPGNRGTCSRQASQAPAPSNPGPSEGTWRGATVNRWSPSTCFYPRVIVTTNHIPIVYVTLGPRACGGKDGRLLTFPRLSRPAGSRAGTAAVGTLPARKPFTALGPPDEGGLLTPRGRPARKASGAAAPGPGPDRGGPRARALGASQRRTRTRRGRARPAARPAARRPRGLGPGAEGRAARRPQRRPPARPRGAPRAPHLPPAPAARPQRRAPRPGRRRRHRRPPEGPRGRSSLGGTRLPRAASGGRALARAANPARGLPALGEPPGGLRRPPIGGARRSRPRSAAQ